MSGERPTIPDGNVSGGRNVAFFPPRKDVSMASYLFLISYHMVSAEASGESERVPYDWRKDLFMILALLIAAAVLGMIIALSTK